MATNFFYFGALIFYGSQYGTFFMHLLTAPRIFENFCTPFLDCMVLNYRVTDD
jgi:hypothetical protein